MCSDGWAQTARTFYAARAPRQAAAATFREFTRAYRALIRRLDMRAGMTVLDAGCGVGPLPAAVCDRGMRVVGLDISAESVRLARRRVPSGSFVEGDLTALPFADGQFERVISLSSLEFCADRAAAVHELRRVLKPGGRLYVEVTNGGFALLRLPSALMRPLRAVGFLQTYGGADYQLLDAAGWKRLLSQGGWRVRAGPALRPWNHGGLGTRFKNLLILAARHLCPLGGQYMIGFTCTAPGGWDG